jgi:hypothetical protein
MSSFDNALKDMEKEHPNAAAFVKEHQNDKITISFRDFVEKSANTTAEIVTSQSVALMGALANEICQRFICILVRELFVRGSFDGSEGTNT